MLPKDVRDKTIIVAPLDWGMGHATRCISLIKRFVDQNNKVIFAGTDVQVELIQKDFPDLQTEIIQGYDVTLDSRRSTYLQMLSQLGGLKKVIKFEREIAEELVRKYQADLIISDNRYGFLSKDTTNVIITHQLQVPLPFLKEFVNRRIRKHIESFHFCWVPDSLENPICGNMIKAELKIPKHFIGHLNRFEKKQIPIEYDYLVIISGPEPERSQFLEKMVSAANKDGIKTCFVSPVRIDREHFFCNPSTNELNELICRSQKVISRAGYTTIMEMIGLKKSCILIPTKGQFEQEYLAEVIQVEYMTFQELNAINI